MINIINSVIIIFLMMGVGFYFSKKNILNDSTNTLFGKIIINLTLPATVIVSFTTRFTKKDLISSIYKLILVYILILCFMIVGTLIIKIFSVKTERKAAVKNMTMFANTIFIGLPVNLTLFGQNAIPYIFIYWFASFSTFWTLGVHIFLEDEYEFSIKEVLKKLLTPPLISFGIAILLIVFNIHIPKALNTALQKFGAMTTPMAMLFLGTVIQRIKIKYFKFDKDILLVLMGRFILAPITAVILISIASTFLDIDNLMKKVFIMTASLPIMANIAILSKHYNKDYEFSSLMVGLTTLMGIITIPIYAFILELIY